MKRDLKSKMSLKLAWEIWDSLVMKFLANNSSSLSFQAFFLPSSPSKSTFFFSSHQFFLPFLTTVLPSSSSKCSSFLSFQQFQPFLTTVLPPFPSNSPFSLSFNSPSNLSLQQSFQPFRVTVFLIFLSSIAVLPLKSS